MLLDVGLENAGNREGPHPRLELHRRIDAAFELRDEHGEFIANPRLDDRRQRRAENDVLRTRCEVVHRTAGQVASDIGDPRLDPREHPAQRRAAQIQAMTHHCLGFDVRRDTHHSRHL